MKTELDQFEKDIRTLLENARPAADSARVKRNVLLAIGERSQRKFLRRIFFENECTVPGIALALGVAIFIVALVIPGTRLPHVQPIHAGEISLESLPTGKLLRVDGKTTKVVTPDGSQISFDPNSVFEFEAQDGLCLTLHQGRLAADIRPQPQEKSIRFRTPTMELSVLGTRFTISVEAGK